MPSPQSGRETQRDPTRHSQLAAAATEAEVVALAREFLASLSPYELARIPSGFRPGKMTDACDVTDYALLLVRHDCQGGDGAARCVGRLANFFSDASIQLSRILDYRHDASAPQKSA